MPVPPNYDLAGRYAAGRARRIYRSLPPASIRHLAPLCLALTALGGCTPESAPDVAARPAPGAGESPAASVIAPGSSDGSGAEAVAAAPTAFMVLQPPSPSTGTALAVKQFAALLDRATTLPVSTVTDNGAVSIPSGTWVFSIGAASINQAVIPASQRAALSPEGYIVRRGTVQSAPVYATAGPDDLGTEYGAYALLELLGFGFFHPFDTYVPDAVSLPDTVEQTWKPSFAWRGMHVHTMHPIELMESLLVPSPEHLAEAQQYIDWLVENRQNYFQWVLQDTIDVDAWIPHAAAITAYAHQRGIKVGIDTPYQFKQQNGWVLVPYPGPWENQMSSRLDTVLQADFDVINVELGSSEFIPASDTETMDMLNFSANLLETKYGVQLLSKVHASTGQTAPDYGDINFNFLPGLANPIVGVLPHTVQFYDLYRNAPTYDRTDFSDMLAFIQQEIPERTVIYYPETAYWCSFDIDVPLFLPHYLYSRWHDLSMLKNSGLDGQVNFTSGFEWGYWLNDWATAGFAYQADTAWQDYLRKFTRIFGTASGGVQGVLEDLISEQGQDLLEGDLIAYLIGWDAADELGHLVNTHAQPPRPTFFEVRNMDEAELLQYQDEIIPKLNALEATYAGFVAAVDALEPKIPASSLHWYQEIQRGIHVTALRVGHVRRLYEGTIDRTKQKLRIDPDGDAHAQVLFDEAQALRREAEQWIAAQEAAYRLPVDRLARRHENPTSYEYGYLYTASDAYFWRREELQAIDENICPCLANLNDMIANLVGQGAPLDNLVLRLPTLPNECLDQCIHEVERIEDLGGSQ